MKFSKVHIAIAVGAGLLVLFGFFGYLMWLNNQPPVLAKSPEVDPLTKIPLSLDLNPMRDRSSEHAANEFLRAMREGKCHDQLDDWLHDFRRKRAAFICDSEAAHPLVSRKIVNWEDDPPLRILTYTGKRKNEVAGYQDQISVTLDDRSGAWVVSSYDAMY